MCCQVALFYCDVHGLTFQPVARWVITNGGYGVLPRRPAATWLDMAEQ